MDFESSIELLKRYKIPVVKTDIIFSEKELKFKLSGFDYPVVLKAFSSSGVHKSKKGLVCTEINNLTKALRSFEHIKYNIKKENLKFEGILIQDKLYGQELMLGAKQDPVFGPVIVFGAGGSMVELIGDVAFRVAPLNIKEAKNMLKKTKVFNLIKGKDIKQVIKLISNFSKLAYKEKVNEVDLNPIILTEKGPVSVDFRII